jgi:hypothetical protein
MKGVGFSMLASFAAAVSNLFFHKNSHASQGDHDVHQYLFFYYFVALVLALIIDKKILYCAPSLVALGIGGIVGVLNILTMYAVSTAMQHGPSGLTFAFQNAGSIFPGVVLAVLFGERFGFNFSSYQAAGIMLVILGLCIGSMKLQRDAVISGKWLLFALSCFVCQIIALTLLQGRTILFDQSNLGLFNCFAISKEDDIWLLVGQFTASFLLQFLFVVKKVRCWNFSAVKYGSLGGVANFASGYLLLFATKFAQAFECSIILPCFSVATILLCNIWARVFNDEQFNLQSNALCSFGILVGIVDCI